MARAAYPPILPMRERAAVEDRILKERLDTIVPAIMRERGVDMWLLVVRENFEDPCRPHHAGREEPSRAPAHDPHLPRSRTGPRGRTG
ncbi:hypothetical protein AB5I41_05930 [Sphingomonas sp. MMS24-JH45]